jgi:urease
VLIVSQPSVINGLAEIQIEATFKDGTYLVTVHDPICTDDGNLTKALAGSFFPLPASDLFPLPEPSSLLPKMQPGAVDVEEGKIVLNKGRKRSKVKVTNRGDRPIQVPLYTTQN